MTFLELVRLTLEKSKGPLTVIRYAQQVGQK